MLSDEICVFGRVRGALSFSIAVVDVPSQSAGFRAHFWCFLARCPDLAALVPRGVDLVYEHLQLVHCCMPPIE